MKYKHYFCEYRIIIIFFVTFLSFLRLNNSKDFALISRFYITFTCYLCSDDRKYIIIYCVLLV